MSKWRQLELIMLLLAFHRGSTGSDRCIYDASKSSEYVTCTSRFQVPPYVCEGNGGNGDDKYQIHILETDLSNVFDYDAASPPEIVVTIRSLYPTLDDSKPIILVFHAFKKVNWKVYTDRRTQSTNFIIKSSQPITMYRSGSKVKPSIQILSNMTLPRDSEKVVATVEAMYNQSITSFSGFHEGNQIHWMIGPGDKETVCSMVPYSISNRIHIFKEVPVETSGCELSSYLGYNTHIIDVRKAHDSDFPWAKQEATLVVRSKSRNDEEYYESNVVIVLRSNVSTMEWTFDTSGMDGNVFIITNGKAKTSTQGNLKISQNSGLPKTPPQEFIDYVSDVYGMVASYTKADIANNILMEVPHIMMDVPDNNTTDQPQTAPLPDLAEITASIDGQKTMMCLKEKVTLKWSSSLLDSLQVDDIYYSNFADNDNCCVQILGSEMVLVSSFNDCGFNKKVGAYSNKYSAKFEVRLSDGRTSEVSVSCQIYDIEKISAISKSALYELSLYKNQDFTQTSDKFNVHNNEYVYFVADLKNITDPNMVAVVEECFLSPRADNFLDRHVLITQACPLDSSIHFLNQQYIGIRDERAQKIKFRMNRYFGSISDYYLHCKVEMCSRINTPDIAKCSVLEQCQKRDSIFPKEEFQGNFERDYILAGPIYVRNKTVLPDEEITDKDEEKDKVEDEEPTRECLPNPTTTEPEINEDTFVIGVGLLVGIAMGSFSLGIILTVLTIHCVTINRKQRKHGPPTDIYRFENRPDSAVYEPLRAYDVCPQGHHISIPNSGSTDNSTSSGNTNNNNTNNINNLSQIRTNNNKDFLGHNPPSSIVYGDTAVSNA